MICYQHANYEAMYQAFGNWSKAKAAMNAIMDDYKHGMLCPLMAALALGEV
jgi:hypothetical protein